MYYMHCRVKVSDFKKWKVSMDSDAVAMKGAGMKLLHLWRGLEEKALVFFIMEVDNLENARVYMNPTDIERAADAAGASEFEWHFVEVL